MKKYALLPLVSAKSKILVLGTMPGEKSIATQQYYGHPGNQFWNIMFATFEAQFTTDYQARKALLDRHCIALWNVLESCERTGSQDVNIKNEKVNDFDQFHRKYPGISHIFFESKTAQKLYFKHVTPRPGIEYAALPSTSGLYAGMSRAAKVQAWQAVANTALKK